MKTLKTKITLQVVTSLLEPFQVYFDADTYVIGRSGNADLVIRDPAISRHHARIFHRDSQVFIEDLDSHNGTWLNGLKLRQATLLTPGDTIELAYDEEEGACATSITVVEIAGQESHRQTLIKPMMDVLSSQDSIQPMSLEDYDALRGYAERLRHLNEIHSQLSQAESTDDLLQIILDNVFQLLHPESGAVYLFDAHGNLKLEATRHLSTEASQSGLPRNLLNELIEKGMAVLVHDAYHDTRFSLTDSVQTQAISSLIAAPLMDKDGTLGLIAFYSSEQQDQFTEGDMDFLVAIASLATLRIRNQQLVQRATDELHQRVQERTHQLKARKEELETLDAIVRAINVGHDLDEVLPAVLEQGLKLFPQADKAAFFLRDQRSNAFRALATVGYGFEQIVELAFEEAVARYTGISEEIHQGVFHSNRQTLSRIAPLDDIPLPKSMLVMTLVLDDKLEGFLVLDNFSDDSFNQADLHRLARFRDHATSAVAKARFLSTLQEQNAAIQQAQNQLIMREKMVSLGQLTAGVSHEINNPNNFIRGATQNLTSFVDDFREFLFQLAGDDADEEISKSFNDWFAKIQGQVNAIEEGSYRIEGIVKDLRLVSRLDEAQYKEIDIIASLKACINLLKPTYSEQIDFDVRLEPAPLIYCQAAEMNQVFLNLITNACEAISNPTKAKTGKYGRILIKSKSQDDIVIFDFIDNGPGIAEDLRERVFEAFYTSKDPGQNTGMGLYHCYQILHNHQGSVHILDCDSGAHIQLKLPIPKSFQK